MIPPRRERWELPRAVGVPIALLIITALGIVLYHSPPLATVNLVDAQATRIEALEIRVGYLEQDRKPSAWPEPVTRPTTHKRRAKR